MGSYQWCAAAPADEGSLGVGLSPGKAAGLFSSSNAFCITTFRFTVIGKGISAEHSLKHDLLPSLQNIDQLLDHENYYYQNEPGITPRPS